MWGIIWPEQKDDKNTFLSKVVIVGNSFVGKSSLLFKYTDKNFEDSFISTMGVDFRTRTFDFSEKDVGAADHSGDVKGNKKINVQFYDTAGQERFVSLTTSYYRGAGGVIFVYDVTSLESFNCIANWSNDIDKYCGLSEPGSPSVPRKEMVKVLVGNKCDLSERKVSEEMGRLLADKINAKFIETSAKKNFNVEDTFNMIARDLFDVAKKAEADALVMATAALTTTSPVILATPDPGTLGTTAASSWCWW